MVKLWPVPALTLTDPDGEIDPPEPAEAEIVYFCRLNAAVTLRLAFMVTVQVPVPAQGPDQPTKVEFAPGVAVRVTDVPVTKVVPDGLLVTVPLPVPLVETLNV